MALCFAVAKGRAHNFDLLRVLQRISAITLACRLTIRPRWIRSEINVADGPSRGFISPGPGVAPSSRVGEEGHEAGQKNSPANGPKQFKQSEGISESLASCRQDHCQGEEPYKKKFGSEGEARPSEAIEECAVRSSVGQEGSYEFDDGARDQECEQRDSTSALRCKESGVSCPLKNEEADAVVSDYMDAL